MNIFNAYFINMDFIIFNYYKRKFVYCRKFGKHAKKLKIMNIKFLYLGIRIVYFGIKPDIIVYSCVVFL